MEYTSVEKKMPKEKKLMFAFVSYSTEIYEMLDAYKNEKIETILFRKATPDNALSIAEELLEKETDVIIASGSTGKFLLNTIGHPVVVVDRSYLEIVRAVKKASRFGNRIGLATFESIPEGVRLLEELINVKIENIIFDSMEELIAKINEAFNKGINSIVGSAISNKIANSLGRESVPIIPSQESIVKCLTDARALAMGRRKERRDAELIKTILDNISEGIFAVDSKNKVKIANLKAAELLRINREELVKNGERHILNLLNLDSISKKTKAKSEQIINIKGTDIVVNPVPIFIEGENAGAVATINELSKIQDIEQELRKKLYTKGFIAQYTVNDFIGECEEILFIKEKLPLYANTDANILIQGETGTGKEIIAQSIHNLSARSHKPFVGINCSALPESLLESELFGYEEGAFTGAKRGGKIGLFEMANGGTLYLDEIADVSINMQTRLLRVLEEKQVMHVGGDKFIPINVRIIASSYKNLIDEIEKKHFRPDLYFRLNILRITIPPLRERSDDILLILKGLFKTYNAIEAIPDESLIDGIGEYNWPGNVRQIDALAKRYLSLLQGSKKDNKLFERVLKEIILETTKIDNDVEDYCNGGSNNINREKTLKEMVADFEKHVIESTLRTTKYNKQNAAKILGISQNTLWRKTQ